MLDGLLGRGNFSSKCKSVIKATRTRIEVMQRRAEAKQRFLKEDLAKLLCNGLEINAFGRTEEFIAGLGLLSCYNFVDQSCEYLGKHLSVLQKLRECPEDCRETVASLMFAAARFSELPELRDLRDIFQERYGNGLECFVNQKFVEKLSAKPPSVEKKLQLLKDIAGEFSIQWDYEGFKQRMTNPPPKVAEPRNFHDQPKKVGLDYVKDQKSKLPNGRDATPKAYNRGVTLKERIEHVVDKQTLGGDLDSNRNILRGEKLDMPVARGRSDFSAKKHASFNGRDGTSLESASSGRYIGKEETILKGEDDLLVQRQKHFNAKKLAPVDGRDGTASKMENSCSSSRERRSEYLVNVNVVQKQEMQEPVMPLPGRCDDKGVLGAENLSRQNVMKSTGERKEEKADKLKSCYSDAPAPPYVKSKDNFLPPPYVKSKSKIDDVQKGLGTPLQPEVTSLNPSPRTGRTPRKPDSPYYEEPEKDRHYQKSASRQGSRHANLGSGGSSVEPSPQLGPNDAIRTEKMRESNFPQYKNEVPLPKPRSMRRKNSKSKSSSSREDVGSFEDHRVVGRRSSSRKDRKGLQILFDDEHRERDEEERMMDKLLLHYSKKPTAYDAETLRKKPEPHIGESSHSRSRGDLDRSETLPNTKRRSLSLPNDQVGEPEIAEKVFARAISFKPDYQARHVHPNLPDYDDLAAKFAALKGR